MFIFFLQEVDETLSIWHSLRFSTVLTWFYPGLGSAHTTKITLVFTPKFQLVFYSSQLVIISQQHISAVALSKIHPIQLSPYVSNPWHIIPTNGFSPVSTLFQFSTREGDYNWITTRQCEMPGSIYHSASLAVRIDLPNSPAQIVSDTNGHW